MGITRKVLEWTDELMDKSVTSESDAKGIAMAIASGLIEGAVDACVINTAILVITGIFKKETLKLKRRELVANVTGSLCFYKKEVQNET